MWDNIPASTSYFLDNFSNKDEFKFIKLLICPPLPYGPPAIEEASTKESTSDLLCHISDITGKVWIDQISSWLQPAKGLLPELELEEHWATNAFIMSIGLTNAKDDCWEDKFVCNKNTAPQTTAPVVVAMMNDSQVVLTSNSRTAAMCTQQSSPTQPSTATNWLTLCPFSILFATYDKSSSHIWLPVPTNMTEEFSETNATIPVYSLSRVQSITSLIPLQKNATTSPKTYK